MVESNIKRKVRMNKSGQVHVAVLAGITGVVFIGGLLVFGFLTESVPTGHVGIITNFGKVQTSGILDEGFHFVGPTDDVNKFCIQTITAKGDAACFSKDLQQVNLTIAVQTRALKENAANIFQRFGMDYMSQAMPKIVESVKAETAKYDANQLVEKRDIIRQEAIKIARERLHGFVELEDLSIVNISFSKDYEHAIEQKQVALQLAQQAVYELQRAKVDADKKIAQAEGEAKAIQIRGDALSKNPAVISLEIVQKWDGKSPTTLVVEDGKGASTVLPIR